MGRDIESHFPSFDVAKLPLISVGVLVFPTKIWWFSTENMLFLFVQIETKYNATISISMI